MRSTLLTLAAAASGTMVQAASLSDVCTSAHVQASLPSDDFYPGITLNPSSVTAASVVNSTVVADNDYPDFGAFSYCNVTFTYSHNGRGDQVILKIWLPAPGNFKNRYLQTGGGGLAINSGTTSLPGGIIYGAVASETDGGFGSLTTSDDAGFLLANGTVHWENAYMFGYQAHHELSVLAKEFTKQFYSMNSTKLYSYYQACSEGGREGWSQVQRFENQFDGAIIGAPAFRYGQQQVNHLTSNVVEKTLNYFPPPCELELVMNATITACDPLDGRTDGVIGRSDLCKLHYDPKTLIGKPYYCAAVAASSGGGMGPPTTATPVQNGTVTAQAIAVVEAIYAGLHDTKGRQAYVSYQPGASFTDAQTAYNSTTGTWGLDISGLGGEWVTRYLQLQNTSDLSLAEFNTFTYDTLVALMYQGWQTYQDSLQTNWPDLTPFNNGGGKVIHYHGESDYSIPTASSVHYFESVRQIMYPGLSYNQSTQLLQDWYRLYLVPGGSHCAPNTAQPNGPWPQTNLAVMIDWVEKDVVPTTLNATVLAGDNIGSNQQICAYPLRPLWSGNGTSMSCVYDQASINTWQYTFPAFKLPLY